MAVVTIVNIVTVVTMVREGPFEERHLLPKKGYILGSSFKQAIYKIVIFVTLYSS